VLVSGQGPDELFAGYARYLQTFIREGEEALDKQLWNDVIATHRNNIERDERAIEYNQVSAFFPYLDGHFILTAMSIPSSWKVAPDVTPDRKLIFRELAQDMGLPVEIASAPKKATQYSSGSGRVIAKAVRANVQSKNDSSDASESTLVQAALNKIASEIGIPLVGPVRGDLMMDLMPTMRLIERIRRV
jgi:asparagine synthase (glutamine-hydrolysing)